MTKATRAGAQDVGVVGGRRLRPGRPCQKWPRWVWSGAGREEEEERVLAPVESGLEVIVKSDELQKVHVHKLRWEEGTRAVLDGRNVEEEYSAGRAGC